MATRTYVGTSNGSGSFSSHAIGTAAADRKVVVAVTGYNDVPITNPTATIGGNAATRDAFVVDDAGEDDYWWSAIFSLDIPSGTTADIVITSGGLADIQIAVYALYDAGAAVDSASSGTFGVDPVELDVDTSNGSVLIASGYAQSGGIDGWVGVTQDATAGFGAGDCYFASHEASSAETPRTVQADMVFDSFNFHAITVVSYPPASEAEPDVDQVKYRFFEDGDELPHTDQVTPVIESGDGTGTAITTAADPWAINHPAAATGDLLIWLLTWDDSTNVTSVSAPSGPNGETISSIAGPVASSGTEIRQQAFFTVATGSWSSGTLSFNPSATETVVATCIKIPAGEFDSSDPIGAASTRASSASGSNILSPEFSANSDDGNGKLVILFGSDADTISAPGSNFTTVRNQTAGGVGHLVGVRDSAVTASESIAALTATIAADTWSSIAFVVRPPAAVADGRAALAALNTGIDRDPSDPFGVSIRIENAGAADTEDTFQLQYRLNAGSWTNVTGSSSVIRTVATADYADGADVPEFLTGTGAYHSNNNAALETDGTFTLSAVLGAATAFEVHATLEIQSSDVANDDEIELRIVRDGPVALETYTVTPIITVTNAGGSTIEVDGTPASQAADVDGTVGVTVNTTGTLAISASAVAGAVSAIISVTGSLASQASSIAGVGNETLFTGSLLAQSSAIAGDVEATVNSTGALAVSASSLAGVVEAIISVTGALAAQAASLAGDATTDSTIGTDGTLEAQDASITGDIEVVISVTGDLEAGVATLDGLYSVEEAAFSGALEAQSAEIDGTAEPIVDAEGALAAQVATIEAILSSTIEVNGEIASQDATITGVFAGIETAVFTSQMEAGPATVLGTYRKIKVERSEVGIKHLGKHRFRFQVRTR